jgi:ABC-type phosphate transport system auxiliary subunit
MLNLFSNVAPAVWVNVAAVAGGVILILGLVVISRRGPKKKPERQPRTEAQARAAQANRDRLSGRR